MRQVTIKGGNWFQKPIQAEHHRELAHQNRTVLISLTCTEAREHTHTHKCEHTQTKTAKQWEILMWKFTLTCIFPGNSSFNIHWYDFI